MNPNWTRWITASLSEHFRVQNLESKFPLYIEGQRRPNEIENYAQFRIDGPHFLERWKNDWRIDVYPLININIVQDNRDIYRLDRLIGFFSSYFKSTIPVYEYGDSGSQFGCLTLEGIIRVTKFGQVAVATPVAQAIIEAHYFLTLRV